MRVELFALPDNTETDPAAGPPAQRLALAWAWRQSRSARSAALVDALEPEWSERPELKARALLIRAEHAQLQQRAEAAHSLSQMAGALFASQADVIGLADVLLLQAIQAYEHNQIEQGDSQLLQAQDLATQGGDPQRARYAQLSLGCWLLHRDVQRADAMVAGLLAGPVDQLPPMLQARGAQYQGIKAALQGDYVGAVRTHVLAHHAALATGQLKLAISCTHLLAHAFAELLDPEHQLQWIELGLELARDTGWSSVIAACRHRMGVALIMLGRLTEARALFEAVLDSLGADSSQRQRDQSLGQLANVLLLQGDAEQALRLHSELADRTAAQQYYGAEVDHRIGMARAYMALGRWPEARDSANAALERARLSDFPPGQVMALNTLAAIARPTPREALRLLQQAEALIAQAQGLTRDPELLIAKADALAALGEHAAAFAVERDARLMAQALSKDQAQRRASALQAHAQAERWTSENERLHQLAQSSAERIGVLHEAQQTLEQLSLIGQQLTAQLEPAAMFKLLARHLHQLLALDFISVYRLDAEQAVLVPIYAAEQERPIQMRTVPLDSSVGLSAACVRKGELLLVEGDGVTPSPSQLPGTSVMASMMFSPLKLGERITGVISLQARQRHAFGPRERLICASLSAYVAIALDNALAYGNLAELQRRVAEQEKLTALGGLVAGVAHEINTPVGNSLLAVSTLLEDLDALKAKVSGQGLRRSDLDGFVNRSYEGLQLILGGLQRTGALVRDFKSLAVHQDDGRAREAKWLDLPALCQQQLNAMVPRLAQAEIACHLDGPPTMALYSIPDALEEVLAILLDNALTHAFAPGIGSRIDLRLHAEAEHALIQLEDDGCGIAEAWLARIFEPFSTSRLGQGRSGLGLARARNLVHGLLGGELKVESTPGKGSQFTVRLPHRSASGSAASQA